MGDTAEQAEFQDPCRNRQPQYAQTMQGLAGVSIIFMLVILISIWFANQSAQSLVVVQWLITVSAAIAAILCIAIILLPERYLPLPLCKQIVTTTSSTETDKAKLKRERQQQQARLDKRAQEDQNRLDFALSGVVGF